MKGKLGFLNQGPKIVYWEITKRCNAPCLDCTLKKSACDYTEELNTDEAMDVIRDIGQMSAAQLVFQGGEPLLRQDLPKLIAMADKMNISVSMTTNGSLLTKEKAVQLKEMGLRQINLCLEGATHETHDRFHSKNGSFDTVLYATEIGNQSGFRVQYNYTLTKDNVHELPLLMELAKDQRVAVVTVYFRMNARCSQMLDDHLNMDNEKIDEILRQLFHWSINYPFELKPICAPYYYRVIREEAEKMGMLISPRTFGEMSITKGCVSGIKQCFISYRGDVYPCRYLKELAGNVREVPLKDIWNDAPIFQQLRKLEPSGKCGSCEYLTVCGGCRLRSYLAHREIFSEDPDCLYDPQP
ncbi:radical SAM protein [Microaerobacter geothermalis]|uniref:radical SAM/SPASM domain-containing protein n=1 Tax=Microaerobacter geothermalis TaxID=674972 RepID=UPI001F415562|nr:radical SAM protein [Microaerobacter geothermalis]MCF6095172.1 radical SAM protein [Microaerobacter geothermalis]